MSDTPPPLSSARNAAVAATSLDGAGEALGPDAVSRALALVGLRLGDARGRSGEPILDHARGTVAILAALRVDEPTRTAAALFGAVEKIPLQQVEGSFGSEVRTLVEGMRQLLRLKDVALRSKGAASGEDLETLRRMTLAMASDIRVVLIRLASRLQTLRFHASSKTAPPEAIGRETLDILAPLANRLGLGQLKWELEDLAFRFLEPDLYKSIARQLEERRVEREQFVRDAVQRLRAELVAQGIEAEVSGRPKHIHSICSKMRTKGLTFAEVQDLRAFRVIVDDTRQCYTVLGIVHEMWPPVPREFDDYISRPKPNGYQSLHTIVTADDGRPLEIQIRTRAMHRAAEFGVASHWRYKEVSTRLSGSGKGARTAGAMSAAQAKAADDERITWVRQLLAWQQELGQTLGGRLPAPGGGPDGETERIYVLTPQARVVELPAGATPVDFAYHVHTELGHRCRGARVDGHMVPLSTSLRTGQTVEVVAARVGSGSEGPSRDWLNPQGGYLRSQRARTKVRQWFNALELAREVATGREKVERMLQREGRTALAFEELARRLRFDKPEDLFVAVAKDEVGPRMLEEAVRAAPAGAGTDSAQAAHAGHASHPGHASQHAQAMQDSTPFVRPSRVGKGGTPSGAGVLVVGVDFLMTQLARCCRPAPPDPIVGFVTRGRGVSVHRAECASFAEMARRAPERVLETAWGDWESHTGPPRAYAVDVALRARDRQGLLRDVSEVFARDRINVTAVQTLSRDGVAQMQFTVEVPSVPQLMRTLASVRDVSGVIDCRRK